MSTVAGGAWSTPTHAAAIGVWTAFDPARPRSLNSERSRHHMEGRRLTAEERERWGWLWRKAGLHHVRLDACSIDAYPSYRGRAQDAGNAYPTVKAAIDALVDIGTIPDDGPQWVRWIRMNAPDPTIRGDGLTIVVRREPSVRLDLDDLGDLIAGLVNRVTGSVEDDDEDTELHRRADVALASLAFARPQ